MKRLILGLIGAGMLAGAAPAFAQGWYDNDSRYHSYDRDHDRYDRGRHNGWRRDHRAYAYYGYRTRVCAWRDGERVCWWRVY